MVEDGGGVRSIRTKLGRRRDPTIPQRPPTRWMRPEGIAKLALDIRGRVRLTKDALDE